jgi:hypothetical protein
MLSMLLKLQMTAAAGAVYHAQLVLLPLQVLADV